MVWATIDRFLGCVAGMDIIAWVNGAYLSNIYRLKDVILPMAVDMWEERHHSAQCERQILEIARILEYEVPIPLIHARAYVEALLQRVSSINDRQRARDHLDYLLTSGTRAHGQGDSDDEE